MGHVVLCQGLVKHDLIQPVEKLRAEGPLEQIADLLPGLLADLPPAVDAVQQELAAQVGGKNDDGVLEIHGAALTICNTTVVQYLK